MAASSSGSSDSSASKAAAAARAAEAARQAEIQREEEARKRAEEQRQKEQEQARKLQQEVQSSKKDPKQAKDVKALYQKLAAVNGSEQLTQLTISEESQAIKSDQSAVSDYKSAAGGNAKALADAKKSTQQAETAVTNANRLGTDSQTFSNNINGLIAGNEQATKEATAAINDAAKIASELPPGALPATGDTLLATPGQPGSNPAVGDGLPLTTGKPGSSSDSKQGTPMTPAEQEAELTAALRLATGNKTLSASAQTETPPALSQTELKDTAKELQSAISNQDSDQVTRILNGLGQANIKALESAYIKTPNNSSHYTLQQDIQKNFAPQEEYGRFGAMGGGGNEVGYLQIEDVLNKPDNGPNVVGDVRLMVAKASSNQDSANCALINYLTSLTHSQLEQLQTGLKKQTGQSLQSLIQNSGSMGKDMLDLVGTDQNPGPLLANGAKGSDGRTGQDNLNLAKILATTGQEGQDGLTLLQVAIGGNSPAAVAARQLLDKPQNAKLASQIKSQFNGESSETKAAVNDLIGQGYVSLSTIASFDTKSSKSDISNAIQAAIEGNSPQQKLFAEGQSVALSGKKPPEGSADSKALDFYNQLNKAFSKVGNPADVAQWDDKLATGGSIIGDLAGTYSQVEGTKPNKKNPSQLAGTTGAGDSLIRGVENMSQQDWQAFTNPTTGKQLLADLSNSLGKYATPEQKQEVMALVEQKVEAKTFADSQSITQSLKSAMTLDPTSANLTYTLQHLNASDAQSYKTDPEFQSWVNNSVLSKVNATDHVLANRLLAQVGKTGQPPKLDAVDTALADIGSNASKGQTLQDLQQALQSSSEFTTGNPTDPTDQAAKQALYAYAEKTFGKSDTKTLFQQGRLSLSDQLSEGVAKDNLYGQLEKIWQSGPEGQKEVHSFISKLSGNDQQIARAVMSNPAGKDTPAGQPDLADKFREYVVDGGSNYAGLFAQIQAVPEAQRAAFVAKLENEYSKKYGGDLANDVVGKLPADDQEQYLDLLSLTKVSAQTDLADALNQNDSFGSKTGDGSGLTAFTSLQAFVNAVTEANATGKPLTADQIQQFNAMVSQAQDAYNAAKQKYSEEHPSFWSTVAKAALQLGVFIAAGALASTGVGLIADAGLFAAFAADAAVDVGADALAEVATTAATDTVASGAADTVASGAAETVASGAANTAASGAADTAASGAADTAASGAANTAASGAANTAASGAANTAASGAADTAAAGTTEAGSTATEEAAQTGVRGTIRSALQSAKDGNELISKGLTTQGRVLATATRLALSGTLYTGLSGGESELVNGKFDWSAANLAKTFGTGVISFAAFEAAAGAVTAVTSKIGATLAARATESVLGKATSDAVSDAVSTAASEGEQETERAALNQAIGDMSEKAMLDGTTPSLEDIQAVVAKATPDLSPELATQVSEAVAKELPEAVEGVGKAQQALLTASKALEKVGGKLTSLPRVLANMAAGNALSTLGTAPIDGQNVFDAELDGIKMFDIADEKDLGQNLPGDLMLLAGGEGAEAAAPEGDPGATTDSGGGGGPTDTQPSTTTASSLLSDPATTLPAVRVDEANPKGGSADGDSPGHSAAGGASPERPSSEAILKSVRSLDPNHNLTVSASDAGLSDPTRPLTLQAEGAIDQTALSKAQELAKTLNQPVSIDGPQGEKINFDPTTGSTTVDATDVTGNLSPVLSEARTLAHTSDQPVTVSGPQGETIKFDPSSDSATVDATNVSSNLSTVLSSAQDLARTSDQTVTVDGPQGEAVRFDSSGAATIDAAHVAEDDLDSVLANAQEFARTSDQPVTVAVEGPQGESINFDPSTGSATIDATSVESDLPSVLSGAQLLARSSDLPVTVDLPEGATFKYDPSTDSASVDASGVADPTNIQSALSTAQDFARTSDQAVTIDTPEGATFKIDPSTETTTVDASNVVDASGTADPTKVQSVLSTAQDFARSSDQPVTVDTPEGATFKIDPSTDTTTVDASNVVDASGTADPTKVQSVLSTAQDFARSSDQPVTVDTPEGATFKIDPSTDTTTVDASNVVDASGTADPTGVQSVLSTAQDFARSSDQTVTVDTPEGATFKFDPATNSTSVDASGVVDSNKMQSVVTNAQNLANASNQTVYVADAAGETIAIAPRATTSDLAGAPSVLHRAVSGGSSPADQPAASPPLSATGPGPSASFPRSAETVDGAASTQAAALEAPTGSTQGQSPEGAAVVTSVDAPHDPSVTPIPAEVARSTGPSAGDGQVLRALENDSTTVAPAASTSATAVAPAGATTAPAGEPGLVTTPDGTIIRSLSGGATAPAEATTLARGAITGNPRVDGLTDAQQVAAEQASRRQQLESGELEGSEALAEGPELSFEPGTSAPKSAKELDAEPAAGESGRGKVAREIRSSADNTQPDPLAVTQAGTSGPALPGLAGAPIATADDRAAGSEPSPVSQGGSPNSPQSTALQSDPAGIDPAQSLAASSTGAGATTASEPAAPAPSSLDPNAQSVAAGLEPGAPGGIMPPGGGQFLDDGRRADVLARRGGGTVLVQSEVLNAPRGIAAAPIYEGEAAASLGSRDLQFVDGKLALGSKTTVVWDSSAKAFQYYDHNEPGHDTGAYIKRSGSASWEKIQPGEQILLKPTDIVRQGGEELRLTPPAAAEFIARDTGNPNVRLYLGNQPLSLTDGAVEVGRNITGPDGQKLTDDLSISRSHGTLRYESGTETYSYTDHSSNGSYIKHADGTLSPIHNGTIELGEGDEIRLGKGEGLALKLVSLKPAASFAGLEDAAVYVDGKPVALADGAASIGRSYERGIKDMRVSRDHGTVTWNEAEKSFYFTDSSSRGTYLLQGDQYVRVPSGEPIKITPESDVRLGSADGPKLELFNKQSSGSISTVDHQLYVNGQEENSTDGRIEIGSKYQKFGGGDVLSSRVSEQHATISLDETTGNYRYTDHSTNGSYIQHSDGTWAKLHNDSVELVSGDEVHLGSKDGPVVKVADTPGRELPDGSILYRRPDGDLIKRQDGTQLFDDRAGITTVFDQSGKLTEVNAPGRLSRTLSYDDGGNLRAVNFADGTTYTTTDGTNWKISTANDSATENAQSWQGVISVESDGGLRFQDGTLESSRDQVSTAVIDRPDGSREVQWSNGYTEYKSADINVERQRLVTLSKSLFADAGQSGRFTDMMQEFESRGLSQDEAARTYHQVNRLLQGGADANLSPLERGRLAEQILFEAKDPTTIDQGSNSTCNVTTLEARAFTLNPGDAARLITDVALTGKYTTPTGTVVDLARTGGLVPDRESRFSLQEQFVAGSDSDINIDGRRTYAGQLFEQTAVNIHWAENPELAQRYMSATLSPSDVVQYMKVEPRLDTGGRESEQLVYFTKTADGSLARVKIGDAPRIETPYLTDIYNQIVAGHDANGLIRAGQDSGFVMVGPYDGSLAAEATGKVIRATSAKDFEEKLWTAQQQGPGKMPIVLLVDARDPVIGGSPGDEHAWHVVTVQKVYYEEPSGLLGKLKGVLGRSSEPPQMKVEFANQWGSESNHLGSNAVSAADLFQATLDHNPNGSAKLPVSQASTGIDPLSSQALGTVSASATPASATPASATSASATPASATFASATPAQTDAISDSTALEAAEPAASTSSTGTADGVDTAFEAESQAGQAKTNSEGLAAASSGSEPVDFEPSDVGQERAIPRTGLERSGTDSTSEPDDSKPEQSLFVPIEHGSKLAVERDSQGRIVSTSFAGNDYSFGYDGDTLNRIQGRNVDLTLVDGEWQKPDGETSHEQDFELLPDGTLKIRQLSDLTVYWRPGQYNVSGYSDHIAFEFQNRGTRSIVDYIDPSGGRRTVAELDADGNPVAYKSFALDANGKLVENPEFSFTKSDDGWHRGSDGKLIGQDLVLQHNGSIAAESFTGADARTWRAEQKVGHAEIYRVSMQSDGSADLFMSQGGSIKLDANGQEPYGIKILQDGSAKFLRVDGTEVIEHADGSTQTGHLTARTARRSQFTSAISEVVDGETGRTVRAEFGEEPNDVLAFRNFEQDGSGQYVEDPANTLVKEEDGWHRASDGKLVAKGAELVPPGEIKVDQLFGEGNSEWKVGQKVGAAKIDRIRIGSDGTGTIRLSNGATIKLDGNGDYVELRDSFGARVSSLEEVSRYPKISIEPEYGVSDSFADQVKSTLNDLPKEEVATLIEGDVTIQLGRSIRDMDSSTIGQRPRRHPEGSTYDDIEGYYSPGTKRVTIAENYYRDGDFVPSRRIPGVLRHELGHAIDDVVIKDYFHGLGDVTEHPDFAKAYDQDMKRIGRVFKIADQHGMGDNLRQAIGRLTYYIEHPELSTGDSESGAPESVDPDTGGANSVKTAQRDEQARLSAAKSEAFAELYASLRGGGSDREDRLLQVALRRTLKVMDDGLAAALDGDTGAGTTSLPAWSELFPTGWDATTRTDAASGWDVPVDDPFGAWESDVESGKSTAKPRVLDRLRRMLGLGRSTASDSVTASDIDDGWQTYAEQPGAHTENVSVTAPSVTDPFQSASVTSAQSGLASAPLGTEAAEGPALTSSTQAADSTSPVTTDLEPTAGLQWADQYAPIDETLDRPELGIVPADFTTADTTGGEAGGESFVDTPPASRDAFRQTKQFARMGETGYERTQDGFAYVAADTKFDADGRMIQGDFDRRVTIVDTERDAVLSEIIAQDKTRLATIEDPVEKAAAIARDVEEMGAKTKEARRAAFQNNLTRAQEGHVELLGDAVQNDEMVCLQQALLMKVRFDHAGLDANLVRGSGTGFEPDGDASINHAWVEVRIPGENFARIYDPQEGIIGLTHRELPPGSDGGYIDAVRPSQKEIYERVRASKESAALETGEIAKTVRSALEQLSESSDTEALKEVFQEASSGFRPAMVSMADLVSALDVDALPDDEIRVLLRGSADVRSAFDQIAKVLAERAENDSLGPDLLDSWIRGISRAGNATKELTQSRLFTLLRAVKPEAMSGLGEDGIRSLENLTSDTILTQKAFDNIADPEAQADIVTKLLQVGSDDVTRSLVRAMTPAVLDSLSADALDLLPEKIWDSGLVSPEVIERIIGRSEGDPSIITRMHEPTMSKEHVEALLSQFSPEERQFILEHMSANLNALSIDGISREFDQLKQQLQDEGFLGTAKNRARSVQTVKIVTFDNVPGDDALSYLFEKRTGVKVDLTHASTLEDLPPDGSTFVVFGEGPKDPEMQAALDSLRSSGKSKVTTAIFSRDFHRSLNVFDLVTSSADTEATRAKLADIVAGAGAHDAARSALSEPVSATEHKAFNNILTKSSNESRDYAASMLFFAKHPADAETVSKLLVDDVQYSSLTSMSERAWEVHQSLTDPSSPASVDPANLVVITGLDPQGSSQLVTDLYRRVNGLSDDQLMSYKDALAAAKRGELGGKTLVYLDDAIYSGKQVSEKVLPKLADLVTRQSTRGSEPAEARIATLASTEEGRQEAQEAIADRGTPASTLVSMTPVPEEGKYADVLDSLGAKYKGKDYEKVGKFLRTEFGDSKVATAVVHPWKVPNNNLAVVNLFFADYIGRARAFVESRAQDSAQGEGAEGPELPVLLDPDKDMPELGIESDADSAPEDTEQLDRKQRLTDSNKGVDSSDNETVSIRDLVAKALEDKRADDSPAQKARQFEFVIDANDRSTPSRITVGGGLDRLIMERSGDHAWTVKQGDKPPSTMAADVTVNKDGSYTVSYITDQRADWYEQAYINGPPDQPLVKQVTYNSDGTVTTEGISGKFQPPEGSTFTKEARFGEYWTTPDGSQIWIDGEGRAWNSMGQGAWRAADGKGVLTENMEYVKTAQIKAEKLDAPLEWINADNGEKLIANAGDYKVYKSDGTFYVAGGRVFEDTHSEVPDVDGTYVKKGTTTARRLSGPLDVESASGTYHGNDGDFLVTGKDGETYIVEKDEFERLYKEADALESLKLPEPTGNPVRVTDDLTAVPWSDGLILWDAKNGNVTITDTGKGTSETYVASSVHAPGFKFDWMNGTSEMIMPSGLAGVKLNGSYQFIMEDGGVLDLTNARSSFVNLEGDMSPDRYSQAITKAFLKKYTAPESSVVVGYDENGAEIREASDGTRYVQTELGYERTTAKGNRYLLDSRGRTWHEKNEQWVNSNGTFAVNAQGQWWRWQDGSADWVDTASQVWHHDADANDGFWVAENGATYQEGTWEYTVRTKDNIDHSRAFHAAATVAAMAAMSVAAQQAAQQKSQGSSQQDKNKSDGEDNPGFSETASIEAAAAAGDGSAKSAVLASASLAEGSPVFSFLREVPGKPGETESVTASQIQGDAADGSAKKGDWEVTDDSGEKVILSSKEFNQLYKAVATKVDSPTFEFKKQATVQAEVATEPFDWVDWQGNKMRGEAGDMKVTQPDGSTSSVKPEIFAKTYAEVDGKPGEYEKTAITRAQQLQGDTVVNTLEGIGTGAKGDWLVTGPEGEQYIIQGDKFRELYKPVDKSVEPLLTGGQKTDIKDYRKSAMVRAELIPEDRYVNGVYEWTNPDAATPADAKQYSKQEDKDYIVHPPDGGEPYVVPGAFFRENYHDMPGFPGQYAKLATLKAAVLDGPASVDNPDQGVTSGTAGDYLVEDGKGNQYIVPKAKFDAQYAPTDTGESNIVEPLATPEATGETQHVAEGVTITPWENGYVIRDESKNTVDVVNTADQSFKAYNDGVLTQERRVLAAGDGATKVQNIIYPYGDIGRVERLPTPQEYNEELMKTPGLAEAKEKALSTPQTVDDPAYQTEERARERDAVKEQRWKDLLSKNPKQEKKIRFLIGLTGAGKSSAGLDSSSMELESDEVKALLSGYDGGNGATALMKESNAINDELIERAIAGGYNMTIPGVGLNAKWTADTLQTLHDQGWTTELVFVDIPPSESMSRIISRYKTQGRFVDPGFLVTHGHGPAATFRTIVNDMFTNGDGLDSYKHIWNFVPQGTDPVVLEEGSKDLAATPADSQTATSDQGAQTGAAINTAAGTSADPQPGRLARRLLARFNGVLDQSDKESETAPADVAFLSRLASEAEAAGYRSLDLYAIAHLTQPEDIERFAQMYYARQPELMSNNLPQALNKGGVAPGTADIWRQATSKLTT